MGLTIYFWTFYFHIVKPLMLILLFLPILCGFEKLKSHLCFVARQLFAFRSSDCLTNIVPVLVLDTERIGDLVE